MIKTSKFVKKKQLAYRYFIQLSFLGTNFHGWQKQLNASSIQESIENALSIIVKTPIEIIGAGRTDTGVHAKYYIAHFDVENIIAEPEKLVYQLNCILPFDIAIQKIYAVKPTAHARFDAISRTYSYKVSLVKDPFEKEFALFLYNKPNMALFSEACTILLDYNDFTSFSKLHSDNKTNLCKIFEAKWDLENNDLIFTIKADRFLRNMVRAIVGTILEVGLGKMTIQEFKNVIESKNRNLAGTSVPAKGLFLTYVEYPDSIFK